MVALVLIESYSVMLCHMLKFYLAQLAALLSFKCKATNVAEVMFMRSAYAAMTQSSSLLGFVLK